MKRILLERRIQWRHLAYLESPRVLKNDIVAAVNGNHVLKEFEWVAKDRMTFDKNPLELESKEKAVQVLMEALNTGKIFVVIESIAGPSAPMLKFVKPKKDRSQIRDPLTCFKSRFDLPDDGHPHDSLWPRLREERNGHWEIQPSVGAILRPALRRLITDVSRRYFLFTVNRQAAPPSYGSDPDADSQENRQDTDPFEESRSETGSDSEKADAVHNGRTDASPEPSEKNQTADASPAKTPFPANTASDSEETADKETTAGNPSAAAMVSADGSEPEKPETEKKSEPKLELKLENENVNENSTVYIDKTPEMPKLEAKIIGNNLEGNVQWRLKIEYIKKDSNGVIVRNDSDQFPESDSKSLAVTTKWAIYEDFGDKIRGGKATLSWSFDRMDIDGGEMVFFIRGKNPSESEAASYILNHPDLSEGADWFILGLVKQESSIQNNRSYLQFNEVGSIGTNWSDIKFYPNWGYPKGFGMMQVEDPEDPQVLWDWKANMKRGLQILLQKKNESTIFWDRQISQFNAHKAQYPGITHTSETLHRTTFSTNPEGQQKSFHDAIWIKRYNGAYQGNYIFWDNSDANPENHDWGFHKLNPEGQNYVEQVVGKI